MPSLLKGVSPAGQPWTEALLQHAWRLVPLLSSKRRPLVLVRVQGERGCCSGLPAGGSAGLGRCRPSVAQTMMLAINIGWHM